MAHVIRKRPLIVSTFCIIGFVWTLILFGTILAPSIKRLGEWVPAIYGIIISMTFIAYVGIWHMKRWGVLFFMFTLFFKSLFLIFTGGISVPGLALSLIFLVIFLVYYKRMDVNL